jgi:plastocyanin
MAAQWNASPPTTRDSAQQTLSAYLLTCMRSQACYKSYHFGRLIMKTHKAFSSNLTNIIRASLLTLLGSVLWSGLPARAAEYTVEMTDYYRFNPSYLEIQYGDIVTWVNRDWSDYHNSLSTDGYWYSGDLDYGETYSLQFLAPSGSYGYEDSVYWVLGMTGTIVVKPAAPVQPPPVTLIDPTRLPDGRFQFSVSNLTVSATYIIQASTNLLNWTNLATNVAASTIETWTDNEAAGVRQRFYRCGQSQ